MSSLFGRLIAAVERAYEARVTRASQGESVEKVEMADSAIADGTEDAGEIANLPRGAPVGAAAAAERQPLSATLTTEEAPELPPAGAAPAEPPADEGEAEITNLPR